MSGSSGKQPITSPFGEWKSRVHWDMAAIDGTQDSESTSSDNTHAITRRRAEAELKHIFDLFKNDKHTSVTEEMAKDIKKEHVKVLSKGNKSYLRMWADNVKNHRVLEFLGDSLVDLDYYGWIEKKTKSKSEKRSIDPADALWKEANALLDNKDDHEAIRNKFIELREIFEDQERRKSSDFHAQKQLVELRSEMSAMTSDFTVVKVQMDEVIQLLKEIQGETVKLQMDEAIQLLKGIQGKIQVKVSDPFEDHWYHMRSTRFAEW
ncbi:hypothetical protein V8C42DRAFT_340886 [Trichoderma barbatum]